MVNSEYELKLMLNKEEYENLLKFKVDEIAHTNYYFDNDAYDVFLNKISLRIREKKGKYEITAKVKRNKSEHEGIIMMEENNQSISKDDFLAVINGVKNISSYMDMGFNGLKYMGSMRTIRIRLLLDDNLPMAELDLNTYNGLTDYELEWEIDKDMYPKVMEVLQNLGLSLSDRKVGKSKFVRFMKSLPDVD